MFGEDQTTMEAILIRDQRTTSNWKSTKYQENISHHYSLRTKNNDFSESALQSLSYHVPKSYDNRRIRPSSKASVSTWLRLSACLLALFATSAFSAPRMNTKESRMDSIPRWINPCGHSEDAAGSDSDGVQATPDPMLLTFVTTASKSALDQIQIFIYNYVRDTFHVDFDDLHKTWKDTRYNWLPEQEDVPKQLGEKLTEEYLKTIKFDTLLPRAYEFMQKYAVGIEQILWDMHDIKDESAMHNKHYDDVNRLQGGLLCEIQTALYERGVTPRADVSRDIMPSEIRDPASTTHRNLRDWLIFRDYFNAVEYVDDIFTYLNSTNSS